MIGLYSVVFCFFSTSHYKSPTFPTALRLIYLSCLFLLTICLAILMFMLMLQLLCLPYKHTCCVKTKIGTRTHKHIHVHVSCMRLHMCCFLCLTMRANSSPQFRRKDYLCCSLTLTLILSRLHSPSMAGSDIHWL
jgi:hypothetical protein